MIKVKFNSEESFLLPSHFFRFKAPGFIRGLALLKPLNYIYGELITNYELRIILTPYSALTTRNLLLPNSYLFQNNYVYQ